MITSSTYKVIVLKKVFSGLSFKMAEFPSAKNMSIDIGGMRHPYNKKKEIFTEKDLQSKEPLGQFKAWFDQACTEETILEPNAMCLATASKDGVPNARFVLLKGYGSDGFRFFTNYGSQKGQEIDSNPLATIVFYWEPIKRSVRIHGSVARLPSEESDKYFTSRPYDSQVGAAISQQSTPVASRDVLVEREHKLKKSTEPLVRPSHWGGFIIKPIWYEFWQGQTDRIHDRIRFRKQTSKDIVDNVLLHKGEDDWVYERLQP